MQSLKDALDNAIELTKGNFEEEGGIIIHHAESDAYEFVHLPNANAGTPIAPSLFTADRQAVGKLIIARYKDGWRMHSSFHTHPAFTPYASNIDRTQLFTGFPTNFIYAPRFDAIFKYTMPGGIMSEPTYVLREGDTLSEHPDTLFRERYLNTHKRSH